MQKSSLSLSPLYCYRSAHTSSEIMLLATLLLEINFCVCQGSLVFYFQEIGLTLKFLGKKRVCGYTLRIQMVLNWKSTQNLRLGWGQVTVFSVIQQTKQTTHRGNPSQYVLTGDFYQYRKEDQYQLATDSSKKQNRREYFHSMRPVLP